ncbi:MAG: cytidylate kinase-like family protein [Bacteroidales bacterium]|nr:cytidylate kinase-like family protein [Bacteroidales bacterium]MBN2632801.1 cytidylate kinase-like family protein [Bacteroidales bacterium]
MEKFFDYFDHRNREISLQKTGAEEGPVITISRLTGCDARQVAESVVENLNARTGSSKWKWVDKDIIYDIAKELNTETERVENFYKGIELSNMSEMIMAFSGGFVSDLRVKKAIRDVVLSICKDGHVVLVGRGGVSIARDIINALHIRLIAPFYWRVENVMKKKEMDIEKAEEYVVDTDEKRHNLITTFLEKKSINIDYLFDATINRRPFSISQTAEIIVSMYEKKIGKPERVTTQRSHIF